MLSGIIHHKENSHLIHLSPRLSAKLYPGFERVIHMLSMKENEGAQDDLWELQHYETHKANDFQ